METQTLKAPATPRHLAARSCYVCGDGPHPTGSHAYWSNSEAAREFSSIPAPVGPAPEAAYVATYRPY